MKLKSKSKLCYCHNHFISNFADIASPLFKLTEIKTKFKLTGEYQNAFDTLKSKLAFSPVMIYPYFNKPFRIHCDASGKAIGAVLSQMNNNVDCLASKHLSASEKLVIKKHLQSLATKVFHDYIYGYKTIILQTMSLQLYKKPVQLD